MSEISNCEIKVMLPKIKTLDQLNRITKKVPVDIEFSDLTYSVADSKVKGGWRQLLKNVNGKFQSGELTAILGPSGAGKSTLLNVLAGFVTAGVKGSIKINNKPRDMKQFTKLSSYIMQEDLVQPRLSVKESMAIAANLKLGTMINHNEKLAVIDEVIHLLGLQNCYDTKTEHLSGGQRKRLTVALELVDNPPVIFLDEPTTGLDNVSIKQCMDLLKIISKLDRTVICTIHQPPASLLQLFDQVYIMANGYCIYNGSPNKMVPFLSSVDCICPETHTPTDFIMEVVHIDPDKISTFCAQTQNGKVNMKEKRYRPSSEVDLTRSCDIYQITTQSGVPVQNKDYSTSFWIQFQTLLFRMALQQKRNKSILYIQFFHHLISGILIGGIFFKNGNDGAQAISIFKCCLTVNVFFVYTHVMSPVLLYPLEVKLLKREYFNRWFSLKPYFLALTIINLPMLIFLGILFAIIVFFMTGQPLELDRFVMFTITCINLGLCSQGLGYAIGASFDILSGCVVGPSSVALFIALAIYGMGYKDSIEAFMRVLMSFSYIRFSLVGTTTILLGDRPPLDCDDIYCHYRNADLMLQDLGMGGYVYNQQIAYLTIFTVFYRCLAFLSLKYSMTSELSNKLVYYATKIVKQRET